MRLYDGEKGGQMKVASGVVAYKLFPHFGGTHEVTEGVRRFPSHSHISVVLLFVLRGHL